MKEWNRQDAIKTGAKILSGKMVDDAHKEKSRYCAREFATFKDPSVFAAASDVDNTSLIESEIMSMSEVLKQAKLMQYNLEFCGMGFLPIVLHTDADVARAFCHKRGVGRMKHLDVSHCWLQEEPALDAIIVT